MWGPYGFRVMGFYLRSLSEAPNPTIDLFWWYRPFIYGSLCLPYAFIGSWALVVLYLCLRFHIFHRPVLEKYVFQVDGGPHLL